MSSDTNVWETGVNDNGNGTDNNQYFISDTSDAEKRLTIQRGTGNIGVGTNEPSQLLDVSGNINLSGNIYLSNAGTIYKNGQEYAGGARQRRYFNSYGKKMVRKYITMLAMLV
jgi:hypothetical protein